jgi:hypothetical protein
MSYICNYSLKCSICAGQYKNYFENKDDLIASAQSQGWMCRAGHGHFCPSCAHPVIEKQKQKNKLKAQSFAVLAEKSKKRQERMDILTLMRARGESYATMGRRFEVSGSRASQLVALGHGIMNEQAKIKTNQLLIGDPESIKALLAAGYQPLMPSLKQ